MSSSRGNSAENACDILESEKGMKHVILQRLQQEMTGLDAADKLWLLEQIVHQLRKDSRREEVNDAASAMAADPEIQREIAAIEEEFSHTLLDGLREEENGDPAR